MSWGSAYTPDFRVASIIGAAAGTTAPNDRRLVEGLAGTPTFVIDAIDTGRYAMRMDFTSAATNISLATLASTPRYSGAAFRFRINSGLGTTFAFFEHIASTTTENVRLRVGTTGLLGYSFNNGSTYTNAAFTFTSGRVYAVEVFVDWDTGTTHTLKVRIDGVEVVNTTGGAAIVTGGLALFGSPGALAVVADYADMATYNDVAQYAALGSDWRVYGIEPISDGAHSMTANDFQDDAAANLSNATTTSWSKVDDAPSAAPTVTDFVQQVVLRTTSYMEWVLRSVPSGTGAPVLVCLAAAMHPVGSANPNTVAFRLNSGGNLSTEAAIDTSIASNTLEYRKHHYTTEPGSGAAWTLAMANALRARFGYSGDATPPPALDSVMAFVLAPVTQVSATAAATSATSATATLTVTHHQYALTAAATSATSATAAMTVRHHQYALIASATSATGASAALTVTYHQYALSASAVSATGATASVRVTVEMTASATSATGASAHADAGVELSASATSATSATATLTVSAATQTGGGTTAWGPHVHVPRFLQARSASKTHANATMTVSRSRRQREDDAAMLLLRSL